MKIRYRLEARLDIARIRTYLSERNIYAATHIIARIRSAIDYLKEFSHIGHDGRIAKTYEWQVKGLPYVIVYELRKNEVLILAIFHGAQDR